MSILAKSKSYIFLYLDAHGSGEADPEVVKRIRRSVGEDYQVLTIKYGPSSGADKFNEYSINLRSSLLSLAPELSDGQSLIIIAEDPLLEVVYSVMGDLGVSSCVEDIFLISPDKNKYRKLSHKLRAL